ncbi:hypothetical protein HC891_17485 [Candidatus Gracilibacteria bacterium]|nr:hypothetical protein [Candidatus Gracilibacteria bacterium]
MLLLYPLGLIVFTLWYLVVPDREGIGALVRVFAPYLFLPLGLLLPFLLWRRAFALRLILLSCLAIFAFCFGPALNIPQAEAAARAELRVISWNTYVDGVSHESLRAVLADHNADVVALQEVIREPLREDGDLLARYPYHLLSDDRTAPGMAILSRFPIVESGVPDLPDEAWDMPRIVWARLDLGGGRTALVVNAHPIPPRTFLTDDCRLRCYNRGPRDGQISALRAFVEPLRVSGEPLLLVGDFNVTEREEAYLDLSRGFTDVQRAVGLGMGATWRPGRYTLGIPVLRIDYMFANDRIEPLSYVLDCRRHGSDHCAQIGAFRLR